MTISTLRPDATTTGAGNYTATGAANLHAALADNSDASFIRKTNDGTSSCIIGFGTVALTASQRVKQVRLRVRAQTTTSSGRANYAFGTRVSGLNYFAPSLAVRGLQATQDFTGPWQTVSPDGFAWDQSRIDALRVQVTDYRDGANRAFTYELYLDVDVVNRPTLTVSAPTGTITATAKPDVSWTYSDVDGDGQAYYQIRVFTQAQYSATGFDPVSSAAVWDSGQVASSDSSTVIDEFLANGTHRAYVRAGKLLGTEIYYSSYEFSQFDVNLAPPPTPTLAATYSSTTNRVTLALDGAAAVGFDYQVYEVQRSVDAGSTWSTIRSGAEIVPGANYDVTVFDHEARRGISVQYRVRSIGVAGDNVIASAWSSPASVSVTNDGTWWMKAVEAPTLNRGGVRILSGLAQTVEEDLGVFRPIGRSRAVVVSGTIYGADGDYTIATSSDSEWSGVYALAIHQGTLLVQAPDGTQKYVRVTQRQWSERGAVNALQRDLTISYVEVDA